ncbi:hypothetical protein ANAPC1_00966 [Anaplasma phagocytophilum]|uniref:Uncharacterized protein n=1 Tax=Anaplasma phagocytophilum TaxID=948 RepID=A0AA45ZHV1_ANAPH|nr:hypothetical protein ANAPC1_00966 [Anaplasma phagocytophilum]
MLKFFSGAVLPYVQDLIPALNVSICFKIFGAGVDGAVAAYFSCSSSFEILNFLNVVGGV